VESRAVGRLWAQVIHMCVARVRSKSVCGIGIKTTMPVREEGSKEGGEGGGLRLGLVEEEEEEEEEGVVVAAMGRRRRHHARQQQRLVARGERGLGLRTAAAAVAAAAAVMPDEGVGAAAAAAAAGGSHLTLAIHCRARRTDVDAEEGQEGLIQDRGTIRTTAVT